jgi:hypothetical protein
MSRCGTLQRVPARRPDARFDIARAGFSDRLAGIAMNDLKKGIS